MIQEQQIKFWLYSDKARVQALSLAAYFNLNDRCIAAGLVRNLARDNMHCCREPTPLNDINLIFFNKTQCSTHSIAASGANS